MDSFHFHSGNINKKKKEKQRKKKKRKKYNTCKNKLPWNVWIQVIQKLNFPLDVNCLGKLDPAMRKLISFNMFDLLQRITLRKGLIINIANNEYFIKKKFLVLYGS